ncbi:MAG: lipase family protein [Thermoflexibacter sp.]|jgi:pimeloyl-ACP methyl ester carboxylesterase|nr:lipase family protein [Thermoflexibacter sp.]
MLQKSLYVRFSRLSVFFLISIFIFSSCSKDSDQPAPQYLVSATPVTDVTKSTLDNLFAGNVLVTSITKYSFKVYRVVYKTKDLDNNEIQASGAILVPTTTDRLAIVSYQHGTIRNDNEAPSNFNLNSEAGAIGALIASVGYVVSLPDYIGYGASKQIPHPYEHRKSLATASLDMLRAVREFCNSQSVPLNDRLFLTGYSEGGFATMSMQKMMEEEFPSEFKITASVLGAGAYNKTAFTNYVLNQNTGLSFINNYVWVLQTYNAAYKLNRPMTAFFTEPNAGSIQQNGPFAQISQNPQQLFLPSFREGILRGTDTGMLNAIRDNDVFDWKPQVPTLLVHGKADDFVIPLNSETAYNAMRARGANNVELALVDGNHFTAVTNYVLQMYSYFFKYNR